jgi:hypothetical protein
VKADEPEQSNPSAAAVGDAPPANEAPSKPKRGGRPKKYAYREMRRSLSILGTQRLDGRSAVAVGVRMLKEEIRRDMGGADQLSRAQEVVLESAARAWVILTALDDYIARQPTLVNGRKKTVLPVVQTRMQVAEGLARNLERLSPGLSRVAKDVDLAAELAELSRRRRAPRAEPPGIDAPDQDDRGSRQDDPGDVQGAEDEPAASDGGTKEPPTDGGSGPA